MATRHIQTPFCCCKPFDNMLLGATCPKSSMQPLWAASLAGFAPSSADFDVPRPPNRTKNELPHKKCGETKNVQRKKLSWLESFLGSILLKAWKRSVLLKCSPRSSTVPPLAVHYLLLPPILQSLQSDCGIGSWTLVEAAPSPFQLQNRLKARP